MSGSIRAKKPAEEVPQRTGSPEVGFLLGEGAVSERLLEPAPRSLRGRAGAALRGCVPATGPGSCWLGEQGRWRRDAAGFLAVFWDALVGWSVGSRLPRR